LNVTKCLNTNTFGGLFLLDVVHSGLGRLVCLGPFLDEKLWVGADDMRVQRGGSQVRRRVAWVLAWLKYAGVARLGAARSVGDCELSNTVVLVYGGNKLGEGYKYGYTPLIWPPSMTEGSS